MSASSGRRWRGPRPRRSAFGVRRSAFGEDAYPDVWTKAAALLQSIVKDRPLVDGNKSLGWLATAVFLELNGVEATAVGNDEVYELVVMIAAGHHEVDEIAVMLRSAIEAS